MGVQIEFTEPPRKSLSVFITGIKKTPERNVLKSKSRDITKLLEEKVSLIDNADITDRVLIICQNEEIVDDLQYEFRYTRLHTTKLFHGIAMENEEFTSGRTPIGITTMATARTIPVFKKHVLVTVPENGLVFGELVRRLELSALNRNFDICLDVLVSTHDFPNGLPVWVASKMSQEEIDKLDQFDPAHGIPQPDGRVLLPARYFMHDDNSDDDDDDEDFELQMIAENDYDPFEYDYDRLDL